MGGRGCSSGHNGRQISLERFLLQDKIAKIQDEANKIRAAAGEAFGHAEENPYLRKKQCFCCEEYTLTPFSEYEQCEICGWIDDPFQNKYPDSRDGRNPLSLNEARKQYQMGFN